MKRLFHVMLIGSMIIFANALPVSADSGLNIELQLGKDTLTVNGHTSKIIKPYTSHGTTLVPLRVISAAFHADISWDPKTGTVTLKTNGTTITLVIGSTKAKINDGTIDLSAAPELMNGSTMVPLRFIAEAFGAETVYQSSDQTIRIHGLAKQEADGTPTGVQQSSNSFTYDAETAPYIGNSEWGWTFRNPDQLTMILQTRDGNKTYFDDQLYSYEFYLEVSPYISQQIDDTVLTAQQQVFRAQADYGEVVSQNKLNQETQRGYQVVTHKDGNYYIYRGIAGDHHIFNLIVTVDEATYAKAEAKASYSTLLDSFNPSYNVRQRNVRNVCNNLGGGWHVYRNFTSGVSFGVQDSWKQRPNTDYFYSDNGEYIYYGISPLAAGDTLEAWVARDAQKYQEDYLPGELRESNLKAIKLSGENAIRKDFSLRTPLGTWESYTIFYVIKGDYRYLFHIGYPEKDSAEAVLSLIKYTAQWLSIDPELTAKSKKFENQPEPVDRSKWNTYVPGGFQINLPAYWDTVQKEDAVKATFTGGELFVVKVDQKKADLLQTLEDDIKNESDTIVSQTMETNGDAVAEVLVSEHGSGDAGYINKVYLWDAGDNQTYMLVITLYKQNRTEITKARIDKAVASFRMLKSQAGG